MSLLLLAGTREARALACALHEAGMRDAIVSLAGETSHPATFPFPLRRGGFGGAAGLEAFIRENRISRIVDATHPFAAYPEIARKTAMRAGTDYLRLLRPPWPVRDGWRIVASLDEASTALPKGCRALLATGRKSLKFFEETDAEWLGLRMIDPPAGIGRNGLVQPLALTLNATVADEIATMNAHRVTHLVTKNSGGSNGTARLDAAEALGLQVVMVARPHHPGAGADAVTTVEEAFAALMAAGALSGR